MRKIKYNPYYEDDEILYGNKEQNAVKEEYINQIKEEVDERLKEYPRWRRGQAVFNVAFEFFPERANFLRGSVHDCFHNDDVIDEFLANL